MDFYNKSTAISGIVTMEAAVVKSVAWAMDVVSPPHSMHSIVPLTGTGMAACVTAMPSTTGGTCMARRIRNSATGITKSRRRDKIQSLGDLNTRPTGRPASSEPTTSRERGTVPGTLLQ